MRARPAFASRVDFSELARFLADFHSGQSRSGPSWRRIRQVIRVVGCVAKTHQFLKGRHDPPRMPEAGDTPQRPDPSPAPIALLTADRVGPDAMDMPTALPPPTPTAERASRASRPGPRSARRLPRRTSPVTQHAESNPFPAPAPVTNQTHFPRLPPGDESNPIARRNKPNRTPEQTQSHAGTNPFPTPEQTQSHAGTNPIARRNKPIFVPSSTSRLAQATLFVSRGYEENSPATPESTRQRWGSSRSREMVLVLVRDRDWDGVLAPSPGLLCWSDTGPRRLPRRSLFD